MKKVLCILAACLVLLPQMLVAQGPRRGKPSRKELTEENEKLKNSLDSLRTLVDSLQVADSLKHIEHLKALEDAKRPEIERLMISFDPQASDSLLAKWYEATAVKFEDCVNTYDMSEEVFTSDVSDSVMIARLAAMNCPIALPFDQTVKNYMILYAEKRKSTMGRIIGLSKYYFPIFEETLARYGLPLELKYMAVVESMLNPVATSPAGARGIWQFMFNTAKGYGLEINSFIDDRLDVEKASDAAARYLRDAYRTFGDWSLAISSYNCGAGNIMKAIKRAAGSRNFWDIYPYLKRETRGYVPAFVGVMYAMTYYREYGIEPQDVGMPAAVDTFMIDRKLHFAQIHEVVGVPMDIVKHLNPQYIYEVIPGTASRKYALKLPYNWCGPFMDAHPDSLYGHRAAELFESDVIKAASSGKSTRPDNRIVYKVKEGDYLGRIASRHHVTVKQLKSWNNLKSDKLRVGQILYIYK